MNSGLAAQCTKANNFRGKYQQKGKVFYSEKLAVWGGGGLVSREQLQRFCLAITFFKGENGGKNLSESLRQKAGFCIILHCIQTGWLTFQVLSCPGVLPAGFFRGLVGVIEVKYESLSGVRLCNPMDCSPAVSGNLQAKILEWVAIPFSRGSSQPWESNPDLLHFRQILYHLSHQGSPFRVESQSLFHYLILHSFYLGKELTG